MSQNAGHQDHGLGNMTPEQLSPTAGLSAQIVREIILPEIEREVNYGKNFANLRQIFHSLILAAWYKQNLKDSAFARSYVDLGKTDGIAVDDPRINQKIYDRYVTAYKKGVYNYIREDYDALTASTIPRKYFSGGVEADVTPVLQVSRSGDKFGRSIKGELVTAETYARATHTLWHQQGAFSPVIDDIAAELGLSLSGNDYPLSREVRARGGSILLKSGGRLELTSDEILLIIDPRFAADHAGRGAYQLAVYARNDVKARHELAELRFLIQAAREQGILLATDRSDRLSQRLREWANATTINDTERRDRQNQLIVMADQAHRQGLIAEGLIDTARALTAPTLLTRPVSDFDFTVASDGAAAVKVYSYLKFLDNEGYTPFVLTLTKVIAAVVQDRPAYLIKPDQLTSQVLKEAFTRLGQFRADKFEEVLLQAPGMSSEEINLYRDAAKVLRMVLGQKDERTMREAVALLQRTYPDQFENPLADVPRALLNRRLQQISLVQRRFNKGELGEVISFGDKHGRTEDLGKILERAREAARSGERLTIIGHGDGFDRGNDNVGVYTMFRELKELEKAHANLTVKLLYGNHDVWLLEAMMAIERRDWDVWENNGGDATLQELHKRGGNMFQLMQFMLENFDLYYVDEWEMLHIHGGFAVDSLGEPQLAATKLQALQVRLEEFRKELTWTGDQPLTQEEKRAIWQLMHDMERVVTISRQTWDARFRNIRINIDQENLDRMYDVAKRHILRLPGDKEPTEDELRAFFDEKWQELLLTSPDMFYTLGIDFEFDDSDRNVYLVNRMDRFMARMGVLGVVNGHHHHNRIYNADQRVFGVDTDDDDAGHMVMSARGVEYVSVKRPQADVIASRAEMTTQWDQQKRRIYEQYSQRVLKRLLDAGKLKPTSGEDAAMLADWDWDQVHMDKVNPEFDQWVGTGQMDAEDLTILREILSGDVQVLAKLLEERPDKVGVKAEDREKPDLNGRMVYLRLARPLTTEAGDIKVLRIKGARPRFKAGSRELESHAGEGFDSSPVKINRYGQPFVKLPAIDLVTLNIKPEVQNPQGAQLLEKAEQEYR
ncbi:MAG: hypothetical protein K8I00_08395, partial [Candidatus Omnitrophica bacterium]|nr:hypothetical protein [Candidatus Omnitrophota bacterium]